MIQHVDCQVAIIILIQLEYLIIFNFQLSRNHCLHLLSTTIFCLLFGLCQSCNSSMTKINKPITVYCSHITNILAMSVALSHFLRLMTTVFKHIITTEFSLGQRITKFMKLEICWYVIQSWAKWPQNICLNFYVQADVLYDDPGKYFLWLNMNCYSPVDIQFLLWLLR